MLAVLSILAASMMAIWWSLLTVQLIREKEILLYVVSFPVSYRFLIQKIDRSSFAAGILSSNLAVSGPDIDGLSKINPFYFRTTWVHIFLNYFNTKDYLSMLSNLSFS